MNRMLAIDVGNTTTVFALYDDDHMVDRWRCSTDARRTGDEYHVWLSSLMGRFCRIEDLDSITVSSVVPGVLRNIGTMCERYTRSRPLIVGTPECTLPVDVRVDASTRVGADRLVNTVAAYAQYGGDLIVVDFGTATTFDVVDTDGAYIGGVIAPGIELSLHALHQATAALPAIGVSKPEMVVGKNTLDCMQSGVYWGYLGLIEGICNRICSELGRSMKVIGTGGLARVYASPPSPIDEVDTNLTVVGLKIIHDYNQNRSE